MIKTCIKRKVTVIMCTLVVLLGGIIAYNSLELAMTPNIDLPVALVMSSYTGAAPEEIEDLVTKPIEEQLATITGVDTISSQSSSGMSVVAVEFVDGTDIDVAVNDMRDRIDRIRAILPDDATDPTIMKMDMDAQSIMVGVTSSKYDVDTLYNLLDDNVTNMFEKIEGVSSVSLYGGTDTEIQITVDQNKLENYGITMNTISAALSAENRNMPSGTLKQGSTDITLRTEGQFSSIEDIKNTLVTTKAGNTVMIKDIADVKETEKERSTKNLVNGQEGCMYSLSKQSDANIVTVSKSIAETMGEVKEQYPDFDLIMLTNTADYIELAINNMVSTAFQAAFIAIFVLLIILRSVRMSLIIGVSIPTSIFATFALMYLTGMSLNMMSLGGVVIAIGMLVDNSVVVLENIFKKRSEGLSASDAAYQGTSEVSMAITASTLTTIAVFLPLTFMPGAMGDILKEISYTVCFALVASLVTALTFVPMASAVLMKHEEKKQHKEGGIIDRLDKGVGNLLDKLDRGYAKLITMCLNHRIRSCAIIVAVFLLSLCCVPFVGSDLMATTDEGAVSVTATLPVGTDYETSEQILNTLLERIGDVPEMEAMYASAGSAMSGFSTETTVTLYYDVGDKEDRDRSSEEIADEIESKLQNIAGCEIEVSDSGMSMGSLGGNGFDIQIKGDDLDTLKEINNDLIEKFSQIPDAVNVESSLDDASTEANIVINRAKAAQYGLNTSTIASVISAANSGSVATEYKTGGSEIDVRIMYPDDDIEYTKDLNNLSITTPTGAVIPLTEVASVEMRDSALTITRENQQKYIEITGEIRGLDSASQQQQIQQVLDNYVFPDGYTYEFSGMMEMMQDTFSDLFKCIVVAILLVYMVMASQFESFVYPFIIMFSMPMAITGGLLGLLVTGNSLTASAYMGLIMLVGMVVNNGIVLVDHTNQMLENDPNIGVNEALAESGRDRLRPILMTTLTTVIGMLPVALAIGSGMETNQSLGIVIVFGLTIGTLVTLLFIPLLYSGVNSVKNKVRRNKEYKRKVSDKDERKIAAHEAKKQAKREEKERRKGEHKDETEE